MRTEPVSLMGRYRLGLILGSGRLKSSFSPIAYVDGYSQWQPFSASPRWANGDT